MAKIDHIKLEVGDWRASRDWYVKNLGLKSSLSCLKAVLTTEG
jgi:hypothetical protein